MRWLRVRLSITRIFPGNCIAVCILFPKGKKCKLFAAPLDVRLSDEDVVQPDLLVVCDPSQIRRHIEGPPSLVVDWLQGERYVFWKEFSHEDVLTSPGFPDLRIELAGVFELRPPATRWRVDRCQGRPCPLQDRLIPYLVTRRRNVRPRCCYLGGGIARCSAVASVPDTSLRAPAFLTALLRASGLGRAFPLPAAMSITRPFSFGSFSIFVWHVSHLLSLFVLLWTVARLRYG